MPLFLSLDTISCSQTCKLILLSVQLLYYDCFLACRYVICNSSDLAPECSNPHDTRYIPERILLYDPHPGGTGFSAQASDMKFSLICNVLLLGKFAYCPSFEDTSLSAP